MDKFYQGKKAVFITQAAVIAALYTVLVIIFNYCSFGPIQFRIAEALTILPYFTPAAIPGLSVGCLLSNILGGAAIWDIIFGSGQRHCTAIRQWTGSLHKPLSKCTVAHHHCTIVILQCTRQNLRCSSRSAVHQYSQRDFQLQRLAQGLIRIARLFDFSFRSHQRFAPRQEEVGYFHRLIQQTAAIIAQVDHQRSDSLCLQIKKRLLELFGRIAGECALADMSHLIILDGSLWDGRGLN